MLKSGFKDAIGSCRIIAICRPRIRRISRAGLVVSSSPANSMLPATMRAAGGSRPTTDRQVVVLPHPDSPTSPMVSPSFTVKSMPSTALTTRVPPNERYWVCSPATRSRGAIRYSPLHVAQLRIEPHAQPVPEQLGRQYDQQNAEAREDGKPPIADHQHRPSVRQHRSPGRLGRRNPDAEEAQRGFGNDDDADRQAGEHHRRIEYIGQNVAEDHPEPARPGDLGQLDEFALAQAQDLAADHARIPRPIDEPQD